MFGSTCQGSKVASLLHTYVKLELYFSNVWLSISEVNFDSVPAQGKYQPEEAPSQQKTVSTSSSGVTAEITNQQTETSTEDSAKTQGKGDFISKLSFLFIF